MAVSKRDLEHMALIGRLKAESHAGAEAKHRSLPIEERLRRSWALYLELLTSVDLSRREDDPTPFYDRARALGLYEP